MLRAAVLIGVLTVVPGVASAQQPCTTDARHVVNEVYRHMLERAPDRGSEGWVGRLASGNATVQDVVRAVAKSPEHLQRFGGSSREDAVATMYRHVLGRQADPEGLRGHVEAAGRQGLPAVIDALIDSPEYQQRFGAWGVPGSGGITYCGRGAESTQSRIEPNDRFDYLDRNRSGRVESDEWDGGYAAFDRLDTNGDGRLTRAEFNDNLTVNDNRRSPNFNSLDSNGDGRIAFNEWRGSSRAFDRLDLNGDGVLTRREFRGV